MGFSEGYMISKCRYKYKCDLDMKEGIELKESKGFRARKRRRKDQNYI